MTDYSEEYCFFKLVDSLTGLRSCQHGPLLVLYSWLACMTFVRVNGVGTSLCLLSPLRSHIKRNGRLVRLLYEGSVE